MHICGVYIKPVLPVKEFFKIRVTKRSHRNIFDLEIEWTWHDEMNITHSALQKRAQSATPIEISQYLFRIQRYFARGKKEEFQNLISR
jgi:hypothetical protein